MWFEFFYNNHLEHMKIDVDRTASLHMKEVIKVSLPCVVSVFARERPPF